METNKNGVSFRDFEKEVAVDLNSRPFLKKSKRTLRLVKKLWRLGYSVNDTINLAVLNS